MRPKQLHDQLRVRLRNQGQEASYRFLPLSMILMQFLHLERTQTCPRSGLSHLCDLYCRRQNVGIGVLPDSIASDLAPPLCRRGTRGWISCRSACMPHTVPYLCLDNPDIWALRWEASDFTSSKVSWKSTHYSDTTGKRTMQATQPAAPLAVSSRLSTIWS